jgi:uncharacterized protein (TIGR03437 family)
MSLPSGKSLAEFFCNLVRNQRLQVFVLLCVALWLSVQPMQASLNRVGSQASAAPSTAQSSQPAARGLWQTIKERFSARPNLITPVPALQGLPITIVSAATFEVAPAAPDAIVAAFGANLATRVEIATSTPLPTSLAGTTVRVRDAQNIERFAQLFFVAPTQINFLVPGDTATGGATITITTSEGVVSTGQVQIARVAPGIFTANSTGKGLPTGFVLRSINGVQTQQQFARFDTAQNRFVPVPVDLLNENDQVFLIIFGTGIRLRNSLSDVTARLGGLEGVPVPVQFAGAQGRLVGLDQINIGPINRGEVRTRLAGRGLINLSLTVTEPGSGARKISNTTEIELAGVSRGAAPTVGEPAGVTFTAGQTLSITGGPFIPGNTTDNRVRIGSQLAYVLTAANDRLTIQLPYGVQTGRITVNTPSGEASSTNSLQIATSVSGLVETSDRLPLGGVIVRALITGEQTTTRPDGSFVLPISINPPPNTFFTTLQISPQNVPGFSNHGSLFQRVEVATRRDNRLSVPISLNAPVGRNTAVGSEVNLSIPIFACGAGESATPSTVTFRLEAGATAQFPSDSPVNQLTLSQVQNCHTPKPLPPGVYSARIVQLTPFGTRLNPGGQLIFSNPDNLSPGTQLRLYHLDQRSDSPTLGNFIDIGAATVSADRQRIETATRSITQGGIYFVALTTPSVTSVTGRVVERLNETLSVPVPGALVQARGQATFTDGDGAFVLRNVPVTNGESLTIEASLLRPDGRADAVLRTLPSSAVRPGGVTTVTPDIFFASLTAPANRAPIANTQTVTLDEDTQKVIFLNAGDPDGNPIRYIFTQPAHGTLTGVAPNLIYTPEANYNGQDNFTFRVNDGKVDSNTAVIAITINQINDPPVLTVPGPQTVRENQTLTFEISATDVDIGQTLSFSAPTRPPGSSFIESTRRFSWTPACLQAGTYTVVFAVADNGSPNRGDSKSVQITVLDDNCPPVLALPGTQTVNEGQPLTFTVTATDPDPGQGVTLSAANLPPGASFTPNNGVGTATGQFTWTPTCTQSGGYLLSFTASDNGNPARAVTQTLSIVVNNVSVPPTLSTPQTVYNISEGTQVIFNVTATPGCGNQNLTISSANLPLGSSLGTQSNNNGTVTREFRWTPSFTQAGVYNVTFTAADANDPNAISNRTVTINVVEFNRDPELIVPPTSPTVNVGTQLIFNVSATDTDAGQSVTLSSPNLPAGAIFNTVPGNPATGQFIWTPNFAQLSNFTVTFVATDNGQPPRVVSKNVVILVTGDCEPILNVPGPQTVAEGLPITFTVQGSAKCPGQVVTLSAGSLPPRATFDPQTGQFAWTPNLGEAATYTATFRATDNSTPPRVTTKTVMITVTTNRAPIANNQTVLLNEDTPTTITLTGTDPENQPLTFSIVQPPAHGTLTGTAPNLTYTPVANYNGADSFTFKVNDGRVDSTPGTVSITVNPVNDPPTVTSQNLAISEDTPVSITLQGNDPDGNTLTFTITKQPTSGSLSGTAPNLIYTPNANFFGTDEIRFRANDGQANSNEGIITITVTSVNDAPTITVPGPQTVTTGTQVSFNVTATDPDAGQSLTLTATNLPTGATFTQTNATTGQFTWTPTEAQTGSFVVTFTATDNGLPTLSDSKTVTIVVNPLTTPIVIEAPTELTVAENQAVSFTVTATGGTQGQQFTLNATNLPPGASFPAATSSGNSVSQTFNWTPDLTQAGTYDITFTATRGSATLSKVTRIIVTNVCRPPVLAQPATPVSGTEGQAITFNVTATDPDTGETLTLSANNLPEGATFPVATSTNGTVTQTFNWTPGFNQAGTITVNFTVTDNCSPTTGTDTKSVVFNIANVNRPPVANPQTGDQKVITPENTPKQITLTGSDPDNDPITFIVVTQPQHGTLSGTAPNLTYTPETNYDGPDSFTFKVNDGTVDSNVATVEIVVTSTCSAPVLTVPGAQTIALTLPQDCNQPPVAQPLTFNVTATDPDSGDIITLAAQNLPAGATFNQTNNTATAASGTFTFTPSPFNEAGTFTVTFTATDNCSSPQTATRTVDITLTIPNNPTRWVPTNIPKSGTITTLLRNGNNLFAAMAGAGIFLTTNNGQTWPRIDLEGLSSTDIRAFVAKNVGATTTLFVGTNGGGVYRSVDNGVHWTQVNGNLNNTFVQSMAVSSDGTVFAGTEGGGVFFTTNDGTSWTTYNGGLGDLSIYALTIVGTGANARIYAGTLGSGVFTLPVSSLNGSGDPWVAVSTGLPAVRINTLEASPDGSTLYAGTNGNGVYRVALNGSTSWQAISTGLDNTNVFDLLFVGNTPYAATGGGVFRFDEGLGAWIALNECLPNITIQSLATSSNGTKLFAATNDGRVFIRPL